MLELGNIAEDATIDFKWNSNDGSGASITRATNGTISVYKGNNTVQSTAGVTDTEDFDSTTGVHHVRIDTSADAFYAVGNDYQVVLTGATIDGQTVNAVIARFSIENRRDESAIDRILLAVPNVAAGSNGGLPTVDASNRIAGIQGTKNNFDALNDVSQAAVASEISDALTVDMLIDGYTIQAALRIIAAATAGEVSGAGSATEVFVGLDGVTTRITATVTDAGNRTSLTYS